MGNQGDFIVAENGHRRSRLVRALKRAVERAGRKAIRSGRSASSGQMGDAAVCFRDSDGAVLGEGTVERGATLLNAAIALGIDLDHYCGGQCACGTCRVEVLSGHDHLSEQRPMESMVLGAAHTAAGNRLACQACAEGAVEVCVPRWF